MIFVDTHCHLYDEAYDGDREEALQRALEAGVATLLLPDIDTASTPRLEALYRSHPEVCRPMAGLHPTSVGDDVEQQLRHVEQLLFAPRDDRPKYVGVGEIGMDLYWDSTFVEQQRIALRRQMEWAERLELPVALHIRKAMNEVFALLRDMNRRRYRGVMHCFGGSLQEAHRAIEMGFYIGIGGVVTFKNATMAKVAKEIPIDYLLLETDAPYLSPVPHRGKRNESAYIPLIAQCVAEIRGVSIEEIARCTTENAARLFAL